MGFRAFCHQAQCVGHLPDKARQYKEPNQCFTTGAIAVICYWSSSKEDRMSTNPDFVEFIMDQIRGVGDTRYRKMFGEYMVYVNDKPILLVCNDTVFVKKLDAIADLMHGAETGCPYESAKEHFILDIDNATLAKEVISILEPITALPKKRTKKS
jgi:hypothetical protein